MRLPHSKEGVSTIAIAIALVVVIAVVGAYLFLSRTPAKPTLTESSSIPPISTAVSQYVQDINDRSVDGISEFYTPSSVVLWSGYLGGLQGQYQGTDNIRLLYAATIGKTMTMDANESRYAQRIFSPTNVNTTFDLVIDANSTVAGLLNASVNVSQEWNWGSGGWQISKENWAYTHFSASLLNEKYGSTTTFPQWGYELEGGNPNLVSEKSFEWHAGPYLAASVYAFLFGVAAAAALKLRKGPPTG
jgi:hypothetical protein